MVEQKYLEVGGSEDEVSTRDLVRMLGVLTLANMSNFWQRNLLYSQASAYSYACLSACDGAVFVPSCAECPEKKDCAKCQTCREKHDASMYSIRDAACISDEEYGILVSVAFTVCFAFSSIIAGRIADRCRESRLLHASAVFTWSIAGFMVVPIPSFRVLVLSRIVLGIAQGFNAPCAYPVIAHFFRGDNRAFANGVYSVGTYLGSALSSISLILTMIFGWRLIATMSAVVGIFSAGLIYIFVERPSSKKNIIVSERHHNYTTSTWREGALEDHVNPYARDDHDTHLLYYHNNTYSLCPDAVPPTTHPARFFFMHTVQIPRRLWLLYLTTSIRMMITVSVWSYLPVYFSRAFPMRLAIFSVLYAFGTLLFGTVSSALGGAVADSIVKRTSRGSVGHALVPLVGTVLSALLLIAALNASTFQAAITAAIFAILIGECWLGPCMTLLARDVDPSAMGIHVALLLVCNQLTAGLGPWIISLADDGTTNGLRKPLIAVITAASILAAIGLIGLAFSHRTNTFLYKHNRAPPGRRMSPPVLPGSMSEIETLTAARFQRSSSSSNDIAALSPTAIFQRSSSNNGERDDGDSRLSPSSSIMNTAASDRGLADYFSYSKHQSAGGDLALSNTRLTRSPPRSPYRKKVSHFDGASGPDELRSLLEESNASSAPTAAETAKSSFIR